MGPRKHSESIAGSPPLADEDTRVGPCRTRSTSAGQPSKRKLCGHDALGVDRHRRDVTTSVGPSASSGSTALLGSTVFVPQTPASAHVVTEEVDVDHDDDNGDIRTSVYPPEVLSEAKEIHAKFFEKVENVTEALIARTSLRVPGWSIAKVHDWHDVDTGTIDTSSCWSFSDPKDKEGVDGQNAQIAKLIVALGGNGSGRRAIFRAEAERQVQIRNWTTSQTDRQVRR